MVVLYLTHCVLCCTDGIIMYIHKANAYTNVCYTVIVLVLRTVKFSVNLEIVKWSYTRLLICWNPPKQHYVLRTLLSKSSTLTANVVYCTNEIVTVMWTCLNAFSSNSIVSSFNLFPVLFSRQNIMTHRLWIYAMWI